MRAVALLSGGLDSVVSTALAAQEGEVALALTCDYGQRSAAAEIRAAARVCEALGVPHEVVELPWLGRLTAAPLVDQAAALPQPGSDALDDPEQAADLARALWVPNRNGVLVSIGAAYAEARACDTVVCGFNAEEGQTFPDNTPEFAQAASEALAYSTLAGVRVWSPTQDLTKAEIVALGRRIGAPLAHVWSCYEPGPDPCGKCESCRRLRRAMTAGHG